MEKNLNHKDKMALVIDLLKAFIFRGKNGVIDELRDWEETTEIMNDPQYDERIKEIQSRMARSV